MCFYSCCFVCGSIIYIHCCLLDKRGKKLTRLRNSTQRSRCCPPFKLIKTNHPSKGSGSSAYKYQHFILRCSRHNALLNLQAPPKAELRSILGHVLPAGDAQHPHLGIVPQAREQLGCDEEVLARVLAAGNLNHALVDHALVAGVHALVDLVDDAEGGLGHGLEGHEEEDGGDGALATGLAMGIELLEGFVLSVHLLSVCKLYE